MGFFKCQNTLEKINLLNCLVFKREGKFGHFITNLLFNYAYIYTHILIQALHNVQITQRQW